MVKNPHFYHFSQATSDCHFLGSLFSYRKRYKHEINKNMFKNAHFYQFSQATSDCHFLGSLFSFRKRYKHEINKNMFKNANFYHFSQTTSNCHFLESLFSFRKRYKHENNKNICSKMLIFITSHKLSQTVTFWGRYLASESVKIMKIMKIWLHVNETHFS